MFLRPQRYSQRTELQLQKYKQRDINARRGSCSVCRFCPMLTKIVRRQQIWADISHMKYNENTSDDSRAVPCSRQMKEGSNAVNRSFSELLLEHAWKQQNKQELLPYIALNWLVFVMETKYVICEGEKKLIFLHCFDEFRSLNSWNGIGWFSKVHVNWLWKIKGADEG
jgi:hypothetical protein